MDDALNFRLDVKKWLRGYIYPWDRFYFPDDMHQIFDGSL